MEQTETINESEIDLFSNKKPLQIIHRVLHYTSQTFNFFSIKQNHESQNTLMIRMTGHFPSFLMGQTEIINEN